MITDLRAVGPDALHAPTRRQASAEQAGSIRIGVIGCGYWGPNVIRNFEQMNGVELVAVADRRPDRLDYVRQNHPTVSTSSDHQDLLRSDIDGVSIATPIHTHYAIAREALLAGKHVIIEKPMTANLKEAVALHELAQRVGRTLMVGHTFVYNPAVEKLRRIVASGELGRIYFANGARLNLGLVQKNVNVLWDLAPHDVSILVHVLGRVPLAVSARGSSCIQPGIHDVAYLEIHLEGGISALIHVSWLEPNKVRRLTLVGDRKMVVYNDVEAVAKLRIFDKGLGDNELDTIGEERFTYRHGSTTVPEITWKEPLLAQCEDFVHSIRTGAAPRADSYQGLTVVSVLEAADRSLLNRGAPEPVHLLSSEPATRLPDDLEFVIANQADAGAIARPAL